MTDEADQTIDLLKFPDDGLIEDAATELLRAIYSQVRDLANKALERPAMGTDEWAAWINSPDTPDRRRAIKHVHLTRLRILKSAGVNLDRAVVDARKDRATWREIGGACGITRQAAYDRWGKAVPERQTSAHEAQLDVDLVKWALTNAQPPEA